MVGVWRLTRNRYGQLAYDALAARGLTATWMCEYDRALDGDPVAANESPVWARVCDPARVEQLDAPVDELLDGECVVAAFDGEEPLGYLFLSVDATLDVAPLERAMSFDGAYLRRVFVAPEHRQCGVASALLEAALDRAHEDGADRATALVALDNAPSRRLFEKHGFRRVRDHRYARVGPLSALSTRDRT